MGVQTELFIASDTEIASAFPGWRKPLPLLPEPVTRTVRNPFTGERVTTRSRIPADQVEPIEGASDSPKLEGFQFVDQKGLSHVNLAELGEALFGWDGDDAQCEIIGRIFSGPEDAGVLSVLPSEMTHRLATLSDEEVLDVGRTWAAIFRKDAASIQAAFIRQRELARPDSEWVDRLQQLRELAAQASAINKDIFVWITT